jgi:aspartate racemase
LKTIGLIGGLSWFSTVIYYQQINQLINERLGGAHYGNIILHSVNFHEFNELQKQGKWGEIERWLSDIAHRLEQAGADCILICSNTPHVVADAISEKIKIPFIHIAQVTGEAIAKQNISRVGLLGTRFTMEEGFFSKRLSALGIQTIVPEENERRFIHNSIFEELSRGIYSDTTRQRYFQAIDNLKQKGAGGIIFGCSEISLLIKPEECPLPVFDTTTIHARAAVDFAL